ncbi:pyridoxal phosphate-dependent aminotransferase [Deinococcus ficus]|uniref:Histidinol phosphate aminotransferase n=1 Tax=Deinococcus ficus TaxID=317577 RepID=A0A221STI2_9DEIO|nr:histidinol-phosphate transaminase [Deinococcus ficus]ASN79944.1 histidinol phosphate aminotransferase [Deinococcus ficus]
MTGLPPLLPRAPHGGPTATPFRGLDFSVNSNPYGPNPELLRAAQQADHAHYPDPTYQATRARLASWHGVTPDEIALSVGASDLLHRLARAFLPAGATLLSLHVPFGELARAAQLQRGQIQVVPDLPEHLPPHTRLVYVGHPHNPTGHRLSTAELQRLAQQCEGAGALLILDEAYAPFLPDGAAPPRHPNLMRLQSPGKAHGLVGVRPAYAIAAPSVIAKLENLAPAWHVPAGTDALLAALPDAQAFLHTTLPLVRQHALVLAAALREFGELQHHGTPYLLLRVGNAAQVAQALLGHNIRVRDCASYALPEWIRVSTRTPQENDALITRLKEVIR